MMRWMKKAGLERARVGAILTVPAIVSTGALVFGVWGMMRVPGDPVGTRVHGPFVYTSVDWWAYVMGVL